MNEERHELLRVNVTGKSAERWGRLQESLLDQLELMLQQTIEGLANEERTNQVGASIKEFAKESINALRALLAKKGAEVAEIEARIGDIHAAREKKLADARKTHAEADAITFETNVKKLRVFLATHRAFMVDDGDEATLFMGERIEALLEALPKSEAERS